MSLTDVASAISAGLAGVGLILLACQIYLERRDRKNQEIVQLFERMVTPDFRRELHFIYSQKPEDLISSKLDESQQETVTEVTARFEELGSKVRMGIVPREESIKIFYDWVIPCAQQLRPHILDLRQRRGPSYQYREHFDWLAKECKLFQLKRDSCKSVTRNMSLDELLILNPMPIVRVEKQTDA